MKKDTIRSIILVALVIALCFCVVQINELKQNIQRLENNLNYYVNDMRHEFNSVYSNVEQILEEEASIVTDVQAEYGELNPEEKLVGLTVTLIPKELSQDMTLELSYGGKSSVFQRNGNTFTAALNVPLFADQDHPLLTVTTGGITKTQYLDRIWLRDLWRDYLPTLYGANINGSGTYTNATATLSISGSLNIDFSSRMESKGNYFKTFTMISEINGREVAREDMTDAVLNFELYPEGGYYQSNYSNAFTLKEGDKLIIWLEATDALGYTHKVAAYTQQISDGPIPEPYYGGIYIYDPEGNQVYGPY